MYTCSPLQHQPPAAAMQHAPMPSAPIAEQDYDPHTYYSQQRGGRAAHEQHAYVHSGFAPAAGYEQPGSYGPPSAYQPGPSVQRPPQPQTLVGHAHALRAQYMAQQQQHGAYAMSMQDGGHARQMPSVMTSGSGAPASISQVLASSEAGFVDFDATFFDDQLPSAHQQPVSDPTPSDDTAKSMFKSLMALVQQSGVCVHIARANACTLFTAPPPPDPSPTAEQPPCSTSISSLNSATLFHY